MTLRTIFCIGLVSSVMTHGLAGPEPGDLKNVKGWHGAEWGMSTERVVAAIGLPLGESVEANWWTSELDAEVKCYDVPKISVGIWTPRATFCFGGKGQTGLSRIRLNFGTKDDFRVHEELKANYGIPTYESSDHDSARWLLPNTEVSCLWVNFPSLSKLVVDYAKRTPVL